MRKMIFIILVLIFCAYNRCEAALGDIVNSFAAPGFIGSRGLAWDGTYLWNANAGDSLIYKLDPANGNIISSFATPNANAGDLTFVGNELWNVDIFPRTFYSVDPNVGPPWTVEFTKPTHDYLGIEYDGTNMWAADFNSNTIDKLDLSGNLISSFPSPDISPNGLAWDGQYLWNADQNTDYIYKIDPTNGNVLTSFSAPGNGPTGLAFDGQYLWVTDYLTNQIYKMDLGYTPAPPGAVTLLTMLGGMGGWAGATRILRRRKKK